MKLVLVKLAVAAVTVAPHSEDPPKPKPLTPHRLFILERHRLPHSLRATLKRLRGCETRGIRFPENYQLTKGDPRWNGHEGAYQYAWERPYAQTAWIRSIATLPRRLRRHATHHKASSASPAEQDVRTAFFMPSHRSEWECKA